LHYRLAEQSDIDDLYHWINDPDTRAMSLNINEIEYDEHRRWFLEKLSSDDNVLVMALDNKQKIGNVRFEKRQSAARVSINLNPDFRGQGVGAEFLVVSEKFIPENWHLKLLMAEIRPENIASIKTFINAGYRPENAPENNNALDGDIVVYVKSCPQIILKRRAKPE